MTIDATAPRVLFICVKNGGKSQLAAGLLHKAAAGSVTVKSAGTKPGAAINQLAAESLLELDIDISNETPKSINLEELSAMDYVITLGTEAQPPIVDGPTYLNWDTDEPSERGIEGMERMRLVRDDIANRVHQLYSTLFPSGS